MWIVGCGTLGCIAAQLWRNKYPQASIHAETRQAKFSYYIIFDQFNRFRNVGRSASRHDFLKSIGVSASLRSDRTEADEVSARNVLIALPPSSSSNQYAEELHRACRLWAGTLGNGNLVFTSSIGVYGDSFGNVVNEKFRVDTRSQRTTL